MRKLIRKEKNLKFSIGDIVYLKSDLKKKVPCTIVGYIEDDYADYTVAWTNSQKKIERSCFLEIVLVREEN